MFPTLDDKRYSVILTLNYLNHEFEHIKQNLW